MKNANLIYEDEILIAIEQLHQQGIENFTSDRDRAYRNQAVELMFGSLNRRNQDELISFLFRTLKAQQEGLIETLDQGIEERPTKPNITLKVQEYY